MKIHSYRPNGQWLSSTNPGPDWGLRLFYDDPQDRITKSCNNTGISLTNPCPGGGASVFSYTVKKKSK